jgi:hypothetical protein
VDSLSCGCNRRLGISIVGEKDSYHVQLYFFQHALETIEDAGLLGKRLVSQQAGNVVVRPALGQSGQFYSGETRDASKDDARMPVGADHPNAHSAAFARRLAKCRRAGHCAQGHTRADGRFEETASV